MTVNPSFLITEFPIAANQALHWWYVADGEVVSNGCDADPVSAAGLKLPSAGGLGENTFETIALVPSTLATVRWHKAEGASEKQAATAAILEAKGQSLDGEQTHIAAIATKSGEAATAVIARDAMASGLVTLQALGLDPFLVTPAGWIIAPPQEADQITRADLGFETVLRASEIIAPDEEPLRDYIIGDKTVLVADDEAVKASIAGITDNAALNLRSGLFARQSSQSMTPRQKKILGWIALGLLIISLAIPAIRLAKYYTATDAANEKSMALAAPLTDRSANADMAEKKLDAMLVSQNRGNVIFSVPASALFSALQSSQGVSIDRITYRADGTVSAGLSAVRNEEINPVLIALQSAGFVVTATPRTDATGSSKADITVRAP